MDDTGLAAKYGLDPRPLADAAPGPVTVVNLFKLREVASYPAGSGLEGSSGLEAMLTYAAVSGARLAAVGGRFLSQGLMVGSLWGSDGVDWDLVVVAEYPSADAVRSLLSDAAYLEAYEHRRAAVEAQRVIISTQIG